VVEIDPGVTEAAIRAFGLERDTQINTITMVFDSGLFVGAVVNTLKHTFPNVYVLSANAMRCIRNTFVVIAAKQEIDLENLTIQHRLKTIRRCRISFGVVEAGIKTGGWTPELRVPSGRRTGSRASIDTSIDNLKRTLE